MSDHQGVLRQLRARVESVNALYGGQLTDENFDQMKVHLEQILYVLCKDDVPWFWARNRPVRYSADHIEPSRVHEEILKEIESLKNLSKSPKVAKKLEELRELLLRSKDVVHDIGSFL